MTPQEIADAGRKIYEAKFKAGLENTHTNQFVVIDVATEKAFAAPHPEEVIRAAEADSPGGKFFLIRIGSAGAFKVSYSLNAGRTGSIRSSGQSSNPDRNCYAI